MKKSQMEIMGLAVIVILVSVGILFALRFVILKEPTDYKKGFTQSELASNMLSSMLRITVGNCSGMSFTELFQHCARNPSTTDGLCSNFPNLPKTSCKFLNHTVQRLFNQTLGAWNIAYEFSAKASSNILFKAGKPCPKGFKSKLYPIPVDPASQKTLELELHVCD